MAWPDCSIELLPEVMPSSGAAPVRTGATVDPRRSGTVSLLGGDPGQRRRNPLADIDLAGPDHEPSVPRRQPVGDQRMGVEAHDARGRSTARSTRGCEPQRQRCGVSAAMAVAVRSGFGVWCSSAVAATTRPAVQ